MNQYNFIRKPAVLKKAGFASTTLHERIHSGLMPAPINLGGNVSAYLEHEIDAVLLAWASGYSDEQIKSLVVQLVDQRKSAANELLKSLKLRGNCYAPK